MFAKDALINAKIVLNQNPTVYNVIIFRTLNICKYLSLMLKSISHVKLNVIKGFIQIKIKYVNNVIIKFYFI